MDSGQVDVRHVAFVATLKAVAVDVLAASQRLFSGSVVGGPKDGALDGARAEPARPIPLLRIFGDRLVSVEQRALVLAEEVLDVRDFQEVAIPVERARLNLSQPRSRFLVPTRR